MKNVKIERKKVKPAKRTGGMLTRVEAISNQITRFIPPNCKRCSNSRKADRICVNKTCTHEQLQMIICGRCHSDEHVKSVVKPEISIDEYLQKLVVFLNDQATNKDSMKQKFNKGMRQENMEQIVENINESRRKLVSLKNKLNEQIRLQFTKRIESISDMKMKISEFLSVSRINFNNNIKQHQELSKRLNDITNCVVFGQVKNGVGFQWNDNMFRFSEIDRILFGLDMSLNNLVSSISECFTLANRIDLRQIRVNRSGLYTRLSSQDQEVRNLQMMSSGDSGRFYMEIRRLEEQNQYIQMNSFDYEVVQFYVDYALNHSRKYKVRFSFEENASNYVMVGVMPLRNVSSFWVFSRENQGFCKRFFSNNPEIECSRIVKGKELSNYPVRGTQIEMRVCIQENHLDFSDYPHHRHVNANHKQFKFYESKDNNNISVEEKYVIVFAFTRNKSILLESFEEIEEISQWYF